jgi:hypothetical protein
VAGTKEAIESQPAAADGGPRFEQYRQTKRRQRGLDENDHKTVD